MADKIFTGDSAVLFSELKDESEINSIPIASATFEVVSPKGEELLFRSVPTGLIIGQTIGLIEDSGGFSARDILRWDGTSWIKIGSFDIQISETEALVILPGELTQEPGLYRGRIQFTTPDGVKRSNQVAFEAIDPLYRGSGNTGFDLAIDRAWMKLEDLFDGDLSLGGPWLREATFANFDRVKLERLAPDALYGINNSFQPSTTFDDESFPYNQHSPLLTQAVLVEAIMHLMRSYVEQPSPTGENITWFDRRDYLSRWQSVLQIEVEKLNNWLVLFKNEMFSFGKSSSMLVGGYSGFYNRNPRYIRGPVPYIPRY
jgi:hypothetical protein